MVRAGRKMTSRTNRASDAPVGLFMSPGIGARSILRRRATGQLPLDFLADLFPQAADDPAHGGHQGRDAGRGDGLGEDRAPEGHLPAVPAPQPPARVLRHAAAATPVEADLDEL